MSVFRRTRKGRKGGKIAAGKYTIELKDHAGLIRRIGGFQDKRASEELERGILRLVALRASGAAPDAEAARFIESIPVTVQAKNAKNGQTAILPLPADLAADLRAFMALHLPDAPAFPGMWLDKGAEMIRRDLDAAGIPFRNDSGEVLDFHSLRHTCGTWLLQAGVPLHVVQRIMRHSTPTLTTNTYQPG